MSFLTSYSFIFNGVNSLDHNVVIGWIDSSEADVSTNGLNREIKKTTRPKRLRDYVYATENTDTITFTFCIVSMNGEEIPRPQSIKINRWLTSSPLPQLLQFNDCDTYPLYYYAICTQIKDIVADGRLVGKEIKFETNSPFAFSAKTEKTFEVDGSMDFSIYNSADTYDDIYYPSITIETKSDTIVIENMTDQKSVTLQTREISSDHEGNRLLKMDSEKMILLDKDNCLIPAARIGWNESYRSYVSSLDDYMDNIYWPRLLRGMNKLKVTGSCILRLEYEYPRKAGCL